MAAGKQPDPEFSRRIQVDALGDGEVTREIEATADERKALAKRFGLLALESLTAKLRLRRPVGKLVIRVTGSYEAEVVQACVVSLEPVASRLDGKLARCYGLAPAVAEVEREILVDLDEDEPPEPVPPGGIDLGEVVAEQLALDMDPYPRAEGARLERAEWGDDAERDSPFRVLGTLKERK